MPEKKSRTAADVLSSSSENVLERELLETEGKAENLHLLPCMIFFI